MNFNYLKKIFKNEKVLITGHTGFKGTYLTFFLNYLGSKYWYQIKNIKI